MKPYHRNPRQIKDKRFKRLRETLKTLGDLSGIVVNLETGEVAGGHQRLRAMFGESGGEFSVKDSDIQYTERLEGPDAQGTVAHGFVMWRGFKYAYRETRWDAATMTDANLAANLGAGEWDFDTLANAFEFDELSNWFDGDLLKDWGSNVAGLGALLGSEEVPDFQPVGIDEQGRLDQKSPVTCPECGHAFIPK